MHKNGWRPFWAALGAALLVLLPLVGGEHVHMDDAVALDAGCAVDLGGRPYFVYDAAFAGHSCGGMDTQMAREFFYAVSYSAMMNLHLKVLIGESARQKLEAMFKAFAKALDAATSRDARIDGVLSTKGTLKGRCSAAGTTGA